MTILVDGAAWPWRGERWAHLVSDHHLDELHDFANALGVRRLGFQGDHYDVPAVLRDRALAQGAQPVSSRALVAALRGAGLRVRGPRDRWLEADPGDADVRAALAEVGARWPGLAGLPWSTYLRRRDELGFGAEVPVGLAASLGPVPSALRRVAYVVERGEHTIVDVVVARS